MRINRYAPAILFGILCVAFVTSIGLTAPGLPDKMATHFNGSGNPDGWMTRAAYVPFVSLMGLALSLFTIGVMYLIRFFPDWMINLPHKQYWLSPEERPETHAFLLRHGLWLGCMLLVLLGAMHFLTIKANQSTPVRLPEMQAIMAIAAFLCGMAIWTVVLFRRFRKPPIKEHL